MESRAHPAFAVLFVLVVAPLGAAVVIAALLLFGVEPALVFAPGHAMRGFLTARGIHAPNAIGVLTTVAVFWAIITLLGLAWSRWRRNM
jgi:hypothetical protein